jgi:hypothetical protein
VHSLAALAYLYAQSPAHGPAELRAPALLVAFVICNWPDWPVLLQITPLEHPGTYYVRIRGGPRGRSRGLAHQLNCLCSPRLSHNWTRAPRCVLNRGVPQVCLVPPIRLRATAVPHLRSGAEAPLTRTPPVLCRRHIRAVFQAAPVPPPAPQAPDNPRSGWPSPQKKANDTRNAHPQLFLNARSQASPAVSLSGGASTALRN